MFSKLLDKKIDEIRGVVQLSSAETQQQIISDNDIPDDYIEAIQPPPSFLQSVPNLNEEIQDPRSRRIRSENFHAQNRSPPNFSKIFPKEFV
uniref:Uncharacterized protein n=1 Tax=Panagrolaimus superbus TaxID=310955 RepID=A0A914Y7Z2_9BILA